MIEQASAKTAKLTKMLTKWIMLVITYLPVLIAYDPEMFSCQDCDPFLF
jgi:hypothetical protein